MQKMDGIGIAPISHRLQRCANLSQLPVSVKVKNGDDGSCTHHTLLARQHRLYGTCAPIKGFII